MSATRQGSSATPTPTREITADDAIVRPESTIGDPSVPIARPSTAARNVGSSIVRPDAALEHPDPPAVRTDMMIDHADGADTRRATASDASGSGGVRADATTSPLDDGGAASTLATKTRLLERARDALRRGDANAASAALDSHASEVPHGLLLDEARSTRLRALCVAGRAGEATDLADAWALGQDSSRGHDLVAAACR